VATPAADLPTAPGRAPSPDQSLRYMPGLDVLRGLAILMVLLHHGIGSDRIPWSTSPFRIIQLVPNALQYGFWGVHLFFILSGFLITGILLDTKHDPDYFRNFYLRRVLRIVPAYLLMIALLKITGTIGWRFTLASLLYFSNMPAIFHASPEYGSLWSLSVEEQFYLIWPFAVLKLSRRALVRASIAVIILTPFLRLALLLHAPNALRDIYFKTWVVCDFFSAGALIAICLRTPGIRPRLLRASFILMGIGATALALFQSLPIVWDPAHDNFKRSFQPEPYLILFSGMTLFAVLRPGLAKVKFIAPFLIFLGFISYGLYLVHQYIFHLFIEHWHFGYLPNYPITEDLLKFVAEAGIAIGIAWVSRTTFEKYFLNLKPKHHHAKPTV